MKFKFYYVPYTFTKFPDTKWVVFPYCAVKLTLLFIVFSRSGVTSKTGVRIENGTFFTVFLSTPAAEFLADIFPHKLYAFPRWNYDSKFWNFTHNYYCLFGKVRRYLKAKHTWSARDAYEKNCENLTATSAILTHNTTGTAGPNQHSRCHRGFIAFKQFKVWPTEMFPGRGTRYIPV